MKVHQVFISTAAVLALVLALAVGGRAQVVGRLTQVEGRVDLLKGGNLPAAPVKVDDTVAPGDVIRTKSLSRARITFIDHTTLTISPESRIAIEAYLFDPAQNKRNAVLEIFQGLALAVVNKILQTEEPDFVIKTQTALLGVRGTEIGIRLQPNSSTILNFKGLTQVGNIFPEVGQLFLKAFKVAFSLGPWKDDSHRWVLLRDMQGTTVAQNLPPTKPYGLTRQDRQLFMRQLTTYVPSQTKSHLPKATMATSTGTSSPAIPASVNPPGGQNVLSILSAITVPPKVVPQPQTPPPAPPSHSSSSSGSGGSSGSGSLSIGN
jgi:hypothetical protein